MRKLYEILEKIIVDVNLEKEKELVTDGYIDSFDIVTIIDAIEEMYDVNIPVDNMIPENFESVESMWAMISSIKGVES